MKIFFLFVAILLIANQNIMSQDSPYYDAPFGGGGGYIGGWMTPKLDGINLQLKSFGVSALATHGFYTSGGEGFIYLGFIKNLRIGGIGFGGSISKSSSQSLIYANGSNNPPSTIYKEAIYSLSGGGLTVEYTLPYVKNFGISVGAIIGRGNISIQMNSNFGNISWADYWKNTNNITTNIFSTELKNNYWIITPTLNIDIPAYYLVSFRIGMGYQFTFGSSWTYDNNQEILNAPSDNNGNNLFLQVGVFVGLFSY